MEKVWLKVNEKLITSCSHCQITPIKCCIHRKCWPGSLCNYNVNLINNLMCATQSSMVRQFGTHLYQNNAISGAPLFLTRVTKSETPIDRGSFAPFPQCNIKKIKIFYPLSIIIRILPYDQVWKKHYKGV